jgi:DMSO/TMAO reductase YedYZ molybdopterin-dependent catalytic subunit
MIRTAAGGTALLALGGGLWLLSDDLTREARAQTRADGRPRLPPGQRVIKRWKPMGGEPGNPSASAFELKVHGEVERPFTLDMAGLLARPRVKLAVDVHCVTGWSALGVQVEGVRVKELAEAAKLTKRARYVIFEAAHGYTANVPLAHALGPSVLIAHRLEDKPLPRTHGAPARVILPDLYFWKSAKWVTGIRFSASNQRGYWERRGYHDRGDPWKEERYA